MLEASKEECEIFSLAYHNAKQLHKFKYATVLTLGQLLSNRNFIAMVRSELCFLSHYSGYTVSLDRFRLRFFVHVYFEEVAFFPHLGAEPAAGL